MRLGPFKRSHSESDFVIARSSQSPHVPGCVIEICRSGTNAGNSAEQYIKTFAGLLKITVRLEVKKIISEGNDVAVFFELQTKTPAEAMVLVAEWHHVRDGRIFHAQSAFDGRPYAAMFAGAVPRN